MNLKDIVPHKIYECIGGSHAYGTNVETSDVDLRGIYMLPREQFINLDNPVQQVSDTTNDITFYEMKRFFELAANCNPNIIELLWIPKDCIKIVTPAMQMILDNQSMFISQKAFHTFSGYAYAQIKKAKGQNKWINNPQPDTPPDKMDFCWIINPWSLYEFEECAIHTDDINELTESFIIKEGFPFRPISFKDSGIIMKQFKAAKMEHCHNVYRLYGYGEDTPKGPFRGPNQQLVLDSIPKEDEWKRLSYLMIYNEEGYNRALKDWKAYHDWMKNRNEARWIKQESGELDYDAKNMMHCVRLLWSGKNILINAEPLVRFTGEQQQMLLDIRNGKWTYETCMEMVEREMEAMEELKKNTSIPHEVNKKNINKLYKTIMKERG